MHINPLSEFKPRKATFGFKIEDFQLEHIIPIGELLKHIDTLKRDDPELDFKIEYGMPYKGRSISFKVYTNDIALASIIRTLGQW